MLRTFEQLTEQEKTKAIELNYEAYFADQLTEENKRRVIKLIQKRDDFASKWELQNGDLSWERNQNSVVTFTLDDVEHDEMDVENIIEKYSNDFDVQRIKEDMQEYIDLTTTGFNLGVEIYNNELSLHFYKDWVLTSHLSQNSLQKRNEIIEQISNDKLKAKRKEQQFKKLFSESSENQDIEELMKTIQEEGVYDFPWLQKLEGLIKEDFNQLRGEITKELEYLYSDQFTEDVVANEMYKYDKQLYIVEKV